MAAISRMMRVTSCNASHTNCKKVFGFFGGIRFSPKVSFLLPRSEESPVKPIVEKGHKDKHVSNSGENTAHWVIASQIYSMILGHKNPLWPWQQGSEPFWALWEQHTVMWCPGHWLRDVKFVFATVKNTLHPVPTDKKWAIHLSE